MYRQLLADPSITGEGVDNYESADSTRTGS